MRDIDLERKAVQRLALKPLGFTPRLDRIFSGQVSSMQDDAMVLSLPFSGSGQALQDPVSGALYAAYNIDGYGATYAP